MLVQKLREGEGEGEAKVEQGQVHGDGDEDEGEDVGKMKPKAVLEGGVREEEKVKKTKRSLSLIAKRTRCLLAKLNLKLRFQFCSPELFNKV